MFVFCNCCWTEGSENAIYFKMYQITYRNVLKLRNKFCIKLSISEYFNVL